MPKVEFCARIAEVSSMRRARFAKRCLDNLPCSSPLYITQRQHPTKFDSSFELASFTKVPADYNAPASIQVWSPVQIGIV